MAKSKNLNQKVEDWVNHFCIEKSVAEIENTVIPFVNGYIENAAKAIRAFEEFVYLINPYDSEDEAKRYAFDDSKLRDQEHNEALERQIEKTRAELEKLGGYKKAGVFSFSSKGRLRDELSTELDFLTGKVQFQSGKLVYQKAPQSNEKRSGSRTEQGPLDSSLDRLWGEGFFYAKAVYTKYKSELEAHRYALSKYRILPDGHVGTVNFITKDFGRKIQGHGDSSYLFTYTQLGRSDRNRISRNIKFGGGNIFLNSDLSNADSYTESDKLNSLGFSFKDGRLAPHFTEKQAWWSTEIVKNKEVFLGKISELISKEKALEQKRYLGAMAASRSEEQRSLASTVRTKLNYSKQKSKLAVCPYCSGELGTFSGENCAELDHIYPVSKGGLSTESNLVYICKNCNRDKGRETLSKFIRSKGILLELIHKNLDILGKDY